MKPFRLVIAVIAFLALLTSSARVHAQLPAQRWQQMPGPYGGAAHVFLGTGSSRRTIYAGTQNGVFRSSDSGSHWSPAGLQGLEVQHLALFTPLNSPDVPLFAAATSDLYRSIDSGRNWSKVLIGGGEDITGCVQYGQNVVVSVSGDDPAKAGIYSSTDAGVTWRKLLVTLPSLAHTRALAVSGSYLVAATRDDGVVRSTNGTSWQTTYYPTWHAPLDLVQSGSTLLAGAEGGFYISTDNGLDWLTPPNSGIDTLVDNVWHVAANGITFVVTTPQKVLFSTDAGRTWTKTNGQRGISQSVNAYGAAMIDGWFFASTRPGIFRSSNASAWTRSSDGEVASTIYDLATQGGTLFAMQEDAVYRSTDRGSTWIAPRGTEDLLNVEASRLFTWSGDIYALGKGFWVWRNDAWSKISGEPIESATVYGDSLFGSIGLQGVLLSEDGAKWIDASNGLPHDTAYTEWVASSGRVLYAFVRNLHADPSWRRAIFRSVDNGASWTLADSLATDADATASSELGGTLYLGTNMGMFQSTDAGLHWSNVLSIPSDVEITTMQRKGDAMIVGLIGGASMASGLYWTNDGSHWTLLSGSVSSPVTSVAWDDQYAYLGTLTSAVWRSDITVLGVRDNARASSARLTLKAYPNPASSGSTLSVTIPEATHASVVLLDITGAQRMTVTTNAALHAGTTELPIDVRELSEGIYIAQLVTPEGVATCKLIVERGSH